MHYAKNRLAAEIFTITVIAIVENKKRLTRQYWKSDSMVINTLMPTLAPLKNAWPIKKLESSLVLVTIFASFISLLSASTNPGAVLLDGKKTQDSVLEKISRL